jgi:hypothetical protein
MIRKNGMLYSPAQDATKRWDVLHPNHVVNTQYPDTDWMAGVLVTEW